MLGLHRDKVELYSYSPEWKTEYEKEKKILVKVLSNYALDIQHVGSTSIPNLCAKPIIDIAVAVKDEKTLEKLIPILTQAGYDVKNSIEESGEILAHRGPPELRTHHVHVEVINSTYWNNHILFRDYLLSHPNEVKKYEQLKKQLKELYENDRQLYTASKNDFIQSIIQKAKLEK